MKNEKIMIFGEVLFDIFSDGKKVLGGAPFNVSWHLNGLGVDTLFVGRVGNDENGEDIVNKMKDWKMDMSGMQIDEKYPTGRVTIELENGQPSFDIEADQAYDFINADEALKNGKDFGLLYYGSLALRTQEAKENLKKIKDELKVPVFVDINLREPWWNKEEIEKMIENVDYLKLNDDELYEIMGSDTKKDLVELGREALDKFGNKVVIVTAGENGAHYIAEDKVVSEKPRKIENLVDTVGAGDALSAVSILGFSEGWPLEVIAKRAVDFSSDLCENQGATISSKKFYENKLNSWKS